MIKRKKEMRDDDDDQFTRMLHTARQATDNDTRGKCTGSAAMAAAARRALPVVGMGGRACIRRHAAAQ